MITNISVGFYHYFAESQISMTTTRVFQNGNSQALRIPSEMRTTIKDYIIRKIGDVFIAYPAEDPWAPAREIIGSFPSDFMNDRNQPSIDDISQKESL